MSYAKPSHYRNEMLAVRLIAALPNIPPDLEQQFLEQAGL